MPTPFFIPPVAPSPGTRHSPEIKLLTASFGDGYEQVSPDGLNHIRRVLDLRWNGVLLEERNAIMDFLMERQGYLPFWYQPFGSPAPIKWTCRDFSSTADAPWKVSAKFIQHFG